MKIINNGFTLRKHVFLFVWAYQLGVEIHELTKRKKKRIAFITVMCIIRKSQFETLDCICVTFFLLRKGRRYGRMT